MKNEEYWGCPNHLINKEGCSVKQGSKIELDDAFLQGLYKLKEHSYIFHAYVNQAKNVAIDKEMQKIINAVDRQIRELEIEKETLPIS